MATQLNPAESKIIISQKGRFLRGQLPWNIGRKLSISHRQKLSLIKKANPTNYWLGKKRPEVKTWLKGPREGFWKGKKRSIESRTAMSDAQKKNPNRYWLGKKRLDMAGANNPSKRIEIRKKIGLSKKGEKSNLWKGGITPINKIARASLEYKLWRESVFKRDNFTCVWCYKKGGELNADHIKKFSEYPALRFAIDNGRTLCVPCHRKTETYGNKKNI